MFHTTHIHVPRNRRPSALRTFITSSSFGPPDTKEPIRRGIMLTAVACVLLLIGSILTWLGFNDVFNGRISMTGPLLIALSLLLLLLSFRQFLLARKRNPNNRSSMQLDSVNGGSVTAVVVNHDDGLHPSTVIVDRYNRIGSRGAVTVHRPCGDDCLPPSYHEVTQLSNGSNTPSCATHEGLDEMPPTYEETMGCSIYPLHSLPFLLPGSQSERSRYSSSPTPLVASSDLDRGRGEVVFVTAPEEDGGVTSRNSAGGRSLHGALHNTSKSSPKTTVISRPGQNFDSALGIGWGGGRGSSCDHHAGIPPCPVLGPSQHALVLPPLHVSAPASSHLLMSTPIPSPHPFSAPPSPRQLSTPTLVSHPLSAPPSPRQLSTPSPSPHHFSAPPSPRRASPRHLITPPPQYMSICDPSQHQLSAPLSLCVVSAQQQSFHNASGPPSPHANFSAPSSPHFLSGQHSLTPPPQYTSAPPSPHQLSAPASPLLFSAPRSPPLFVASPLPVHASLPPPHMHQNPGPVPFSGYPSHQLPGQLPPFPTPQPFPNPAPSPHTTAHQLWATVPKVGSSNSEGYRCFTYNYVTPLPMDTSTTPTRTVRSQGETSYLNYTPTSIPASAASNCTTAPLTSAHHAHADSIADRFSFRHPCPPHAQGSVFSGEQNALPAQAQSERSTQETGEASNLRFSSRTDIQASI